VPMWAYNQILFHWVSDHEILLYGIYGFIEDVDFSAPSGVRVTQISQPSDISVYPNPSSGDVSVDYSTKTNGSVTIELWDESGKRIEQLFNGEESTGSHQQAFTLPKALHGAFFLRVSADGTTASAKINLQ
jgi:hypothetical protein